jgi:esterase
MNPSKEVRGTRAWVCLIALASLLALAGCSTLVSAPWKTPDDVKLVRVNGYPMAYAEEGSGPALVVVHGLLTDYRSMAGQKALSDAFTVRRVSLRHFYPEKWDGSGSEFSVRQHALDLAALLERSSPPVNVMGWSYGGLVALEVARTRPDLVRRLVLVEAPTGSLLAPETEAAAAARRKRATDLAAVLRSDLERGATLAVDGINGPGAWGRLPPANKNIVRDNAWTLVGAGVDDAPPVSCSEFGALKMPVLLIHGENTGQRFKDLVAAQARCLPAARVVTIPNAAHASPSQNPGAVNEAVRQFLR